MENKHLIVTILAVVGLTVGLVFKATPVLQPITINVPEDVRSYGSTPGSDFTGPRVSFNGLGQWDYSSGLNKASTTVCTFKSPAATTTLDFASIQATTGTTTVIRVEIGKSTLIAATTTLLGSAYDVASGKQFTIVASSSPSVTPEGEVVIEPNRYINFKTGGYQGSLNVLVGSCRARLLEN